MRMQRRKPLVGGAQLESIRKTRVIAMEKIWQPRRVLLILRYKRNERNATESRVGITYSIHPNTSADSKQKPYTNLEPQKLQ